MSNRAGTASSDPWYSDETAIMEELRRINRARPAPPEIPGYDDLREISRGGQGVIYAAVQRSTRRRVAIKVLRDGTFATDTARLRFEREIDLVASLNHAGIVRIYDSGVSQPPDPRVYFVMEFIEGVPLHEHVRTLRQGDPRDVLHLFVKICRAVSFAHQHGVIHRDLKPSNVRIDRQGEPHILDFGLAKIADNDNPLHVSSAAVSIAGQFLGSLPWASPEQAHGDQSNVDVRSDVYALGVMLYQMLTDKFPYDVEGSLREVLERIVTAEPTRPSSVDGTIDNEVETIVLKCLAKEPDRRYQSAGELAQDVERYLKGEPIQAKRDSAWYTMRKRMHRYRLFTAAAALLAFTLTLGIAATLWQAQVASDARDHAQSRFDDVRELARRVMFDLHDQISEMPGSRAAREMLINTSLEYLEKLSAESENDLDLVEEIIIGYARIGDLHGRPNTPNLGNTAAALENYAKAEALISKLESDPKYANNAQRARIELDEAIGETLMARGETDKGLARLRDAVALAHTRMDAQPESNDAALLVVVAHIKLGDALGHPSFANAGRSLDANTEYDAAEPIARALIAAEPENPSYQRYMALVDERKGTMAEIHGPPEEALARHTSALAMRRKLLASQPNNFNTARDVAISLERLGNAYRALGDMTQASNVYAEAALVFDEQLKADPDNVTARMNSALNHERIGHIKREVGDADGAVASMQKASDLFVELAERDPANEQAQFMAAVSHINLGDVLGHPNFPNIHETDKCIEQYEMAIGTFSRLYDAMPDNQRRKRFYALANERLGTMMLDADDVDQARTYFEESRRLRIELAEDFPENTDVLRDVAVAHESIGKVLEHEQNFAAAIEQYTTARETYAALATRFPGLSQLSNDIAVVQGHIDRCTDLAQSQQ